MRTIDVVQSARDYFIDGSYWGDDEEGVRRYRRAKGLIFPFDAFIQC